MMRHPETELLIGYAEGWLDPNVRSSVDEHIESCITCASETFQWFSILDGLKGRHLHSAPRHAIHVCESIFQLEKPVSTLRRILAKVVFDSSLVPATAGVRGVSNSQQILIRSEEFDVHLRVGGAPRAILGQILQRQAGDFVSGARVGVLCNEVQLAFTITDVVGEFRIGVAPAGNLQLQADMPSNHSILADFTIREMSNE